MIKKQFITALFTALFLLSCSRQDFYEVPAMPGTGTPIETPTRLTINLDPTGSLTTGVHLYLLHPETHATLAHFAPGTAVDVETGSYHLLAVNEELEGARLEGTKVTLNVNKATKATEETDYISSSPALHAAFRPLTLAANSEDSETLSLASYTRPLRIDLTLQGITAADLASCRVTLTGVQATVDLSQPFGSTGRSTGSATLLLSTTSFTPNADGNLASSLTARLLGLDTTVPQLFSVLITLKDGGTQTLQQDVSHLLSGFYSTTETTPATLNAVISFGLDGVIGTITGWTPGWDEDVTGQ